MPARSTRRDPRLLAGAALAAALCLASLGSCSTAPKPSEVVTETRNRAAEATLIGNSWLRQGRYDLALRYFTEALQLNASVDNQEGVIRSTNSIGRVDMALGDLDEAERLFTRAAAQAEGGRQELVVLSRTNLGELHLERGEADLALAVFEELLALPPAGGMTDEQQAVLYHDRGTARRNLGDLAGAREDLEKSLSLNLAARRSEAAAADYYMIASVDARQERPGGRRRCSETGAGPGQEGRELPGNRQGPVRPGSRVDAPGDPVSAHDYFERAYGVSTTLSLKADMRKALAGLVGASEALGRTAEAEEYRRILAELDAPL